MTMLLCSSILLRGSILLGGYRYAMVDSLMSTLSRWLLAYMLLSFLIGITSSVL